MSNTIYRKHRTGFTLVELLVSMVALSIVALTVGSILYYTWIGWKRNQDSVNMQRDASLTMRMVAKEVRRTAINNISGGNSLICGTKSFVPNGKDLNYNGMAIVDGWLIDFTSTVNTNTGSVQVTLKLDTGYDPSAITATFYSRN